MLDLLVTLGSAGGTLNESTSKCNWQDLPGGPKLDNDYKEVNLPASYERLLQRLQDGAPVVVEALESLATAADKASHVDAATDARVAGGWLRRLGGRDFTRTTWESDYSRLDGFWACLRDANTTLETAFGGKSGESQNVRPSMEIVAHYLDDLTQLQPEMDCIERSRTTLAQKVLRQLFGTMAALRSNEVAPHHVDDDDFWNEESVGSTTR